MHDGCVLGRRSLSYRYTKRRSGSQKIATTNEDPSSHTPIDRSTMTSLLRQSLLLSLYLACAARACNTSHADFVKGLPGLNAPLPTNWFSGYLDYEFNGQQVHTHYTLVAAENDWDEDHPKPLIYWSNGGPGASSL